jgi:hypothetical protein
LAYFDIFHYPLLNKELLLFHGEACTQLMLEEALTSLLHDNSIFYIDGFYSLHNDITLATKRRKANKLAAEQMVTAYKAANIIARFPYVKGLAVSGSLSKNYGSEKTDIDFFIITAANRLWIARTIMHLYKKFTFLTGRHNWFCMNYYVDEAVPEIEEKNIFTAIEIITLLPMHGRSVMDNFMRSNRWTKAYFPLYTATDKTPEIKKGFLVRLTEKIFNNSFGDYIDNQLMRITDRRWKRKVVRKMKNEKGNALGMRVSKHCSKPDPKNFQDKVIREYQSKLDGLLQPKTVMNVA